MLTGCAEDSQGEGSAGAAPARGKAAARPRRSGAFGGGTRSAGRDGGHLATTQWPLGRAVRTNPVPPPTPHCHHRRCRAARPQSTQGGDEAVGLEHQFSGRRHPQRNPLIIMVAFILASVLHCALLSRLPPPPHPSSDLPHITPCSSHPSSPSSSHPPTPTADHPPSAQSTQRYRSNGIRARPLYVRTAAARPLGPTARTNPPPRCHPRRRRAARPQSTQRV